MKRFAEIIESEVRKQLEKDNVYVDDDGVIIDLGIPGKKTLENVTFNSTVDIPQIVKAFDENLAKQGIDPATLYRPPLMAKDTKGIFVPPSRKRGEE